MSEAIALPPEDDGGREEIERVLNRAEKREEDQFLAHDVQKLGRQIFKQVKAGEHRFRKIDLRFIIQLYYSHQEERKAAANRLRGIEDTPPLTHWFMQQSLHIEEEIKRLIVSWSRSKETTMETDWALTIKGIDAVIAAGLWAFLDIEDPEIQTVGHWWRYSGSDPSQVWKSRKDTLAWIQDITELTARSLLEEEDFMKVCTAFGRNPVRMKRKLEEDGTKPTVENVATLFAKRPYNATMKTLRWKIGHSFKLVSNRGSFYGREYQLRKEYEVEKNGKKDYADQAEEILRERRIGRSTEAYKWYKKGMLPPGQIDNRAMRYAAKLFLAHYFGVAYRAQWGKEPPLPYPIANPNMSEHTHVKRVEDVEQ